MSFLKALANDLNREDILFAAAVVPAAFAWIILESFLLGAIAGAAAYAGLAIAHEYLAEKYSWPRTAAGSLARKLWDAYNPF